ncbi:hypothetical protein [Asanoa siamensis]|uniref:Uncharacterized protein n=1 Tax=Asanoa siamensis TaxID=926357 RepID=A0ABQ4CKV3_9ACTN|nr:hypothetical protein [Asanoa siamensis]GIF71915.1 hypothetical protein Asi02nite_14330 [Asanoa siamensis]
MAWHLNPALTRFRAEVDERWPRRDRGSDGTIGDAAHQQTDSDHNPDADGSVDAWDMDRDGVDVNACIAAALRHESIQYVIWNRRITSRSWGLGTWRPYTGSNPHDKHVHFNTRPSHERSTKPWFPPAPPEVEVIEDSKDGQALIWRVEALAAGRETVGGGPLKGEPVAVVKELRALARKVDALPAAAPELDYDRLAEALLRRIAAGAG